MKFTAIVLAGDRGATDPVALYRGAPCKALVEIKNLTLVQRVVAALHEAESIGRILTVGPKAEHLKQNAEAKAFLREHQVEVIEPAMTPCTSAMAALERVDSSEPVLITTADLGFPAAAVFDDFVKRADASACDVICGLVSHETILAAFPDAKRTALRFKSNRSFSGANLFLVRGQGGRNAVAFWRRVEKLRKKPWRIAKVIGLGFLCRYFMRRLTLDDALQAIGQKAQARASWIEIKDAKAAVDIDKPHDWDLVSDLTRQF